MRIKGSPGTRFLRIRDGDTVYEATFNKRNEARVSSEVGTKLAEVCPGITIIEEDKATEDE